MKRLNSMYTMLLLNIHNAGHRYSLMVNEEDSKVKIIVATALRFPGAREYVE